jgi:hypothetical protein
VRTGESGVSHIRSFAVSEEMKRYNQWRLHSPDNTRVPLEYRLRQPSMHVRSASSIRENRYAGMRHEEISGFMPKCLRRHHKNLSMTLLLEPQPVFAGNLADDCANTSNPGGIECWGASPPREMRLPTSSPSGSTIYSPVVCQGGAAGCSPLIRNFSRVRRAN